MKTAIVTLNNLKGESLTVTLGVDGKLVKPRGTACCHEVVISVLESSAPLEIEAGTRAVYGDGSSVNNWHTDGLKIFCTRGDIKRLGTYPIYFYVGGDKTKRGRFGLYSIPEIDRFNIKKILNG